MSHRFKLFRLFAIDVSVDSSWLVCAALVTWTLAQEVFPTLTPGLSEAGCWSMALAAAVGLFSSIVIHEFAHSLTARRFGIEIHAITLFIFGGMAELEHEPRTAKGELATAIAGPAASLLLGGVFFLGETAAVALDLPDALAETFWYLAMANMVLVLFNLVPAFPLDGGRVLRAALWAWREDLMWATSVASAIGSGFGVFLMVIGLLDILSGTILIGIWNLLIGLFLRGAALASREEAAMHSLLAGVPVAEVMNRSPIWVPPDLSLEGLVENIVYRYPHLSFPVCRQRRLIGVLGLERLSLVPSGARAGTQVHEIMTAPTDAEMVAPQTELLSVLRQLRRAKRRLLWVVDKGELVGVLTLDDVRHSIAARRALGRRPSSTGVSALPFP